MLFFLVALLSLDYFLEFFPLPLLFRLGLAIFPPGYLVFDEIMNPLWLFEFIVRLTQAELDLDVLWIEDSLFFTSGDKANCSDLD